jgi:hypothetical protein
VEQEKTAIARQRSSKHVSAAMNQHAIQEELLEAVFSVWSILRLLSKGQWEKLVGQRLESGVSSSQLLLNSDSSWLAVSYHHC